MRHNWREISKFHHLRSRGSPSTCGSEKISIALLQSLGGGRKSKTVGFDREVLLVATAKQTSGKPTVRVSFFVITCFYENILNLDSTSPSPGRFKKKRIEGKAGEMPRKPFPTRQFLFGASTQGAISVTRPHCVSPDPTPFFEP